MVFFPILRKVLEGGNGSSKKVDVFFTKDLIFSRIYGIKNCMMQETKMKIMNFVVCIDNTDYPASLEKHKIYRVLPDEDAAEDGDIHVVDESGEDYLYPASYFTPIEVPKKVEESLLRAS